MTPSEFNRMKGGRYDPEQLTLGDVLPFDESEPVANGVDWRNSGAVTGVKNQGSCGSCWAFSTTGALEGFHKIKSGSLLSLSEQQLVDCSTANLGCNGGWPYKAITYAATHPLELESDYPYKGKDGTCAYVSSKGKVSSSSYSNVQANSATAMASAVAKQPVSVLLEAD